MMQKQEDEVIDLSLQDIYGNPINRSTANCYVIKKPGRYKLPLVYGNAIKNGKVNTAAFTNNGGSYSHDFVDGAGKVITTPVIDYPSFSQIYNADILGVVEIELGEYSGSVFFDENEGFWYAIVHVYEVPQTGANVLITARDNMDDYNVWTWHLWLWPHDLSPVEITNETGVKYNIMPVNLASKYDSDGTHIKNWFYQFGRPMPLLCSSAWNSTTDHTPGSITKASKASSLAKGLNNPSTFYYNSKSPYNWFGTKSYYNLWDAACTDVGSSDNDTVKTVYDPCPVGWKVPNGRVFSGLEYISKANNIVKFTRYIGDTIGVGFPFCGSRLGLTGDIVQESTYLAVTSFVYATRLNAVEKWYVYDAGIVNGNNQEPSTGFSVRPVQDDNIQMDVIMISFKIGTTTYQAESGMTWFEWVNSSYNTKKYKNDGSLIVRTTSSMIYTIRGVRAEQLIVGGTTYDEYEEPL